MSGIVISGPMLATFLLASLVLAVTPGPAVVYIIARTLAQGRRAGLASVGGVALGNLGNAIGASIGLAALFAVSSVAFNFVKFAGAVYLVYLGVNALRRPAGDVGYIHFHAPQLGVIFRDGFLVAFLNPKTTIFFAAFLPQFMDPAASMVLQSAIFGALFVVIAATTDTIYVLAASVAGSAIGKSPRIQTLGRYASAATFIGLGIFTAASGTRAVK